MKLEYTIVLIKLSLVLLLTLLTAPSCLSFSNRLLRDAGCTMQNYRGNEAVYGMGISFVPILIFSLAFALLLFPEQQPLFMLYLFGVLAVGFAGLLDDLIGNKEIKGLRRHIKSFFHGELTTGFVKAFVGVGAAFIIAVSISKNIWDLTLNLVIIASFTNALNLLDLRPGRCTKVFMLAGFFLVLLNLERFISLIPLLVMLAASGIYVGRDLRELYMLGDTGSNILGITLGFFYSVSASSSGKAVIAVILLSLNILAERVSITKLISNNRFLNYLDSLGRSNG